MTEKVLKGSWVIDASPEDIFNIVTDFERAPEYFPVVAKGMKVIVRNGNHLEIEATTNTFGIHFKVKMKTEILPGKGFKSINESAIAIEDEQFLIEPNPGGTKIDYLNKVTIKNNFLKLFSWLIIGKGAIKFWEWAYIDRLKKVLDKNDYQN